MIGGRVHERHHNTGEQIRDYLREALAVVDELDVPDDLRAVAFSKACDLAAAKAVAVEQVVPHGGAMAIPRGL